MVDRDRLVGREEAARLINVSPETVTHHVSAASRGEEPADFPQPVDRVREPIVRAPGERGPKSRWAARWRVGDLLAWRDAHRGAPWTRGEEAS